MNFNVAQYVAERLTLLIAKEMGYDLPPDRISRIAERAILYQGAAGGASLMSIACAFEIDLLLWGDPKAPVVEIKGFTNIIKEIYEEP